MPAFESWTLQLCHNAKGNTEKRPSPSGGVAGGEGMLRKINQIPPHPPPPRGRKGNKSALFVHHAPFAHHIKALCTTMVHADAAR
jgi:hypothetical protein